ncbi:carbohydrate binding family 9 domain-containing protein [Rhodohalobacter mucosus]|uniref:Hydrolase n=1 Tax=Rhodohalobacter mucosus TaxID=2079485 RepID=A0A316TPP1_9BACT|nr:carbohydrate binding family 9 domain-containing protein [Rhodohalobacter mucosus]PWN05788.1 hydrolase [Rhodohalobacter mucosus]
MSNVHKILFILLISSAWLSAFTALHAEQAIQPGESDSDYTIRAYRLPEDESMRLDGLLTESFWKNVPAITNFTQQDPQEGGQPTQKTEIYVAYDESNLYIGAMLYDSSPDQILAYQKRRDQGLGADDRFMWILDTFNSGRNAYFFETNPAALRGDGLLTVGQGRNLNKAWDGIWDVRTNISDEGWSVEVVIPFRSLDFDPQNSTWGINFQRTVRRDNEEILWAGWRRNQGLFRPQNAGLLTGITGISQGLGLEVKPYFTANRNVSQPLNEAKFTDSSADAGFDVSYSFTPSIRASLTINTDFAETEVDQRRVNLTRFPLRFPEQRDFFLEGSGIFSFAPASGIEPFFSRRIGLSGGQPVPITGGLRILGREGNTNLGFYQIRTAENDFTPAEDFTAARISQNIFSESSVGLIYTRRGSSDNGAGETGHTLGTDLELGTSSFLGDKNLQFQAFFVWHNRGSQVSSSDFLDRTSRGVRLSYPNFPFSGSVSYREFGSAFDPEVGFTPRNGFRRLQPNANYRWVFPDNRILRQWEVGVRYEYLTNLDFEPETIVYRFTPVEVEFESGEQIQFSVERNFEQIFESFDILRDGTVIILPGEYTNWGLRTEFNTARFRKISGGIEYNYEGFWTGTRDGLQLRGTVRPYRGFNLSGSWSRSHVELPGGTSFTTNLFVFRSNLDFTPDIAFTQILQYDDVSDLVGFYNRFRWTLTPGSDLFLVYTRNWIDTGNRLQAIESRAAVKLNYTHRF